MTVLLVRHAVAKARSRWREDDDLRPLTARGRTQAEGLVRQLAPYRHITDVRSSPSIRCIETITPLANKRGLDIVTDKALAEGNGSRAVHLVRRLLHARVNAVLCSHGDVIPEVVEALGFDCEWNAKGSTWVFTRGRALYLEPPA